MADTEQQFLNPTVQEDLEASLHKFNTPIEEDIEPEQNVSDDVPIEYTESYGTGVHQYPGQFQNES